jgi:formylglycine-generating enzyme required for sulfatase activity
MARLFISHSGANNAAAIALREWLCEQGFDDVFLDIDPERGLVAGQRWQEALKAAADRCEAVLFLVSHAWLDSKWCLAEFLLAKTLHKRIFGLIIEPVPLQHVPAEMTAEWQLCQLAGEDPKRTFNITIGAKRETVAFREAGLDLLRRGLERAGLDAKSFPWPPPTDPTRAPYRGLRALEPEDAAIFFGRDAAIVRGLDRIRGLTEGGVEKLFVVLGASGSGKSSFLRAGLWPRLAREDSAFLVLPVIRPQAAVITGNSGLVCALASVFERLGEKRSPGRIKEVLSGGRGALCRLIDELSELSNRRLFKLSEEANKTAGEAKSPAVELREPTIVLAIDQAEELFSSDGAAEAVTFLQMLSEILSPAEALPRAQDLLPQRVLAIATIRSDHYELLQAEPRLSAVRQDLFNLPPVPPAEFKTIIEGPAQRVQAADGRLSVEAALTERLIADARGADALPLLAFTLQRLYADYGSEGKLTLAEYKRLGGVQASIEEAITRALAEPGRAPQIPSAREDQLAGLRAAFIPWLARIDPESGEPTRREARLKDLPQGSHALIQRLIEIRLLVADKRSGIDVVEVAHESLLRQWPALQVWLKADADDLKIVDIIERAAREWARNGRREGWLDHRAERLAAAERVAARADFRERLGKEGVDYLEACRSREMIEIKEKKAARSRDRQRRLAQALVASLTAILLAGGLIWKFQQQLQDDIYWLTNVHGLTFTQEQALAPLATFSECTDCPTMVVIRAASFTMGSPDRERNKSEYPQHTVTFAKRFAVSQTELTFAQWDVCVTHGGCNLISAGSWGRGQQPVINVSWLEAQRYLQWLSAVTGKTYRLLSEAEWEYVAGVNKRTLYFFGNDDAMLDRYAWYEPNADSRAHPVGGKLPNPFGLKDAYGNVSEWVEDCYHDDYRRAPTDGSAWLSGDCTHRVVRGGDWLARASSLRSTSRDWFYYDQGRDTTGVRVARTLAP